MVTFPTKRRQPTIRRKHANKVASKKSRERKAAMLQILETMNKVLLAEVTWLRQCLDGATSNETRQKMDFYQEKVQCLQEQIELHQVKHRQASPDMDTSANFILGMAGNETEQS
jgi:hypothetical protein